jgi:hypothetical protein
MRLRIRETSAVVYDNEFRAMHPNTSFPAVLSVELLNDFGADPVLEGPQPTLTADQYAVYDGVIQDANGNWMTSYVAVDYTAEEIAAKVEQWRQSASCTPFQGKAALFQAGLLDDVEALIANAATDTLTKLAWANAVEWKRNSPMITSLSTALNMADTQVDDLFKAASQIVA